MNTWPQHTIYRQDWRFNGRSAFHGVLSRAHGDGLVTTNPLGGALIENVGGVDGSCISGSFTISFRELLTCTAVCCRCYI